MFLPKLDAPRLYLQYQVQVSENISLDIVDIKVVNFEKNCSYDLYYYSSDRSFFTSID